MKEKKKENRKKKKEKRKEKKELQITEWVSIYWEKKRIKNKE